MAGEEKPWPSQILLADPLSEVARNERRLLLAVAIISIAVVKTGAIPKEITNLGIKFSSTDKSALLWILSSSVQVP